MTNSENCSTKRTNALVKRFDKIQKWIVGICASFMSMAASVLPVSAANEVEGGGGEAPVTINSDLETEEMLGGIITFICTVARYMGIVIVAAGIFMLIFAYKDDNAEAQSRAVRFAVIGAIMLSLKTVLKWTGLIS